uniref:Uncharacterized protein n=1 Tax=Tanacetum cinerariifolium TaxID=118510 RepID=A0A699H3Q1_TANCI|nr:hypothetical protein [Tanacetum cinerariifolium]
MGLSAFIHVVDPTKASMDKLLDQGGSADQGDSIASGGHDAEIKLVTRVKNTAAENVIAERPKCQCKKRPAATGASGSSHPPKKLRGDHDTPSGVATGGKSLSVLKELLDSSFLNTEVDVTAVATLPFITFTISATPEHEGCDQTDSVTRPNLRTINLSKRFVISLDSSHCSRTKAVEVEVDSFIRSAAPLSMMNEAVITTSIASLPSILVVKLDADLLKMALHLEEKFYPHLLTTISSQRWLLTYGLKLAAVKCLNSPEYIAALGSAISHAIEKGMQSGLSPDIDHRKACWSLADVVAYNPATEADYKGALQKLREVNFPLLAELSSHKDATVLGETFLSFALSVANSRVERIRENVVTQQSVLVDVWVPFVEPLSVESLIGATGSIPPITIDDYEIVSSDGQEDAQGDVQGNAHGNVASFPTAEFEKEELDTTPERDPPS